MLIAQKLSFLCAWRICLWCISLSRILLESLRVVCSRFGVAFIGRTSFSDDDHEPRRRRTQNLLSPNSPPLDSFLSFTTTTLIRLVGLWY